ncbi:putative tyrosine-protein kinase YveL [Sporosarcina luteola]|uniref:non-specific protein-tyrosine kinase n=1 Tax=Sporosarcina luteola TaxID=582850 RepID=A0A511Z728_9BACL|nr:CpsD/CapB family tyrosine-protein kinase [Sporosarcina luteola]GEN83253.1 putative tyrosine-protein kinase YveL [Sporosarcina luteola]
MSKNKKYQTAGRVLMTEHISIYSEQFRSIRANINFSTKNEGVKTLLVTSSSVGEGKSTVAANIAIAFAQESKKTLLVDADLRKPTMHYTFNRFLSPGLTNLLISNWVLKDVVKESGIKGLGIITCGPIPSNPAELLSSNSMDSFLEEVKREFDIIIFDAPPLLSIADAQILSEKCDGTIVVVSSDGTEKKNLLKVKETLQNSNAKVIGTVLNNYKLEKDHYYNDYYIR